MEVHVAEPRHTSIPATMATWFVSPLNDDKEWLTDIHRMDHPTHLIKICLYRGHYLVSIHMGHKHLYIFSTCLERLIDIFLLKDALSLIFD